MIDTSLWKGYRMSDADRDFLDAYLQNLRQKKEPDLPSNVFFARFCISEILKEKDLDIDQLKYGYTDSKFDGGVDAIYFFVSGRLITDDTKPSDFEGFEGLDMTLHLIQATTSPHFGKDQIRKFEDFSSDLLNLKNNIDAKRNIYSQDVRSAVGRFRDWYDAIKLKLPKINIVFHISSRGDDPHPDVRNRAGDLKTLVEKLYACECKVLFYPAKALLELARTSRRAALELRYETALPSAHWGKAFVCLVSLKDYIDLISTPSGELRNYVLDPNVRGYLGDEKGVNAEILKTLLTGAKKKQEFWWLNNGVTITASEIHPDVKSLRLVNAHVVNGLQTSREIYKYSQQKRRSAMNDERHILVKVLEADKFTARNITKTTNNQTKVDEIYLRTTTDDIHDRIEAAMPTFGLYYERVKNQYYEDMSVESSKVVTLDYLTRALVAILMQRPEQARGSPAQFVDRYYDKLFNPNHKPEVFANPVKIMKLVDAFLDEKVPRRTERADFRYYIAFDAICRMTKKSSYNKTTVANFRTEVITDAVLEVSMTRIRKLYEGLKNKGIVPDLIAKGADLIAALRLDLEDMFSGSHDPYDDQDLFSKVEQA